MANGFMGKLLWVDLTNYKINEELLDENMCRDYIGGYGLGARILFSRMKPGIDPLGPDNILGFITGPLTGTDAIGGSRYVVVGKSPLTMGWGEANSGGDFGPYLKFSGYDAVFFTGASDKPVYLYIDNGKSELRDASGFWGKDSFETEDIIKQIVGKEAEVACVGPSGEKISLISAIMNNKGRSAARSGLGAVMGSKKLKAVVVRGDMKVPVANEILAKKIRKKLLKELTGPIDVFKMFGTPAIFESCVASDDICAKNWDGVASIDLPDFSKIGAQRVVDRQHKRYGCWHCPVSCGGRMKESIGEYKYESGAHKPEYETLAMFGTDCLNSNIESIIKANDICNRYGLDTISVGATIAFTIECYEKGIISASDTDNIEMTWGNHRSIVAMTEKLAKRDGFGDILADGVQKAAERIGKGADKYAMHIQGQEVPAHDPKVNLQWAISYAMDATPSKHCQGGEAPLPPGVIPAYDKTSLKNRGVPHKIGHCFTHVYNAAGACMFVMATLPHGNAFIESLNSVTGWKLTMADIQKIGERIANMRHIFNIREGLNNREFKVPDRILGRPPKTKGPKAGVTLNEDEMYNEYLIAMDWDIKSVKPSRKKLLELGIEDALSVLKI